MMWEKIYMSLRFFSVLFFLNFLVEICFFFSVVKFVVGFICEYKNCEILLFNYRVLVEFLGL